MGARAHARRRVLWLLGRAITSVSLATPAALGAEKLKCLTDHAGAQHDRRANKLLLAREKLLACSALGCPDAVRADCTSWLTFLDQELPSVLVEARDARGSAVSDVRVFAEDRLLAERLDGRPLRLDPGEHALCFEHRSGPPVSRRVTLTRGDNAHVVNVAFAGWFSDVLVEGSNVPPVGAADPRPSQGVSLWPFVAAGGATAAIGTSLLLGLGVRGDREDCRPCSSEESAALDRRLWAANIPLAAGLALAGVATWMFVASPSQPPVVAPAAIKTNANSKPRAVAQVCGAPAK